MYVMVDIEADGPIPGDYSMISLGAIVVEPALDRSFSSRLRPISEQWIPEALAVSGHSREDTLTFVSDNNGFDWMFVCWYFHHFIGKNPLGFSSQNLGSLYKGLMKDVKVTFKHLRKTKHTHDPLDDARGNAEAMLQLPGLGLKIGWD
jgi:hypothetical protein